ncbi:tannase and feruloyl esterase [Mycena sp. CBHHK59/15]|nr:tannase and feruloyl esterase [Mycena sp. CBHHK59/15]
MKLLLVFATIILFPAFILCVDPASDCLALKDNLHLENTTIIDAEYISSPANVTTPGTCQSSAPVNTPLCRVQFVIVTTNTSAVHAEAWLPDIWYGRFLGVGNGGLNGCVNYVDLDYGTSLHFATIGSDNGHDNANGIVFLNHPEVINDFAWRAIHVEAVIGKQIVDAYYGTPPAKSYFLGCSTGGRQGTQSALKFPEDFDGIVGGSPATDWNHLLGWENMITHYLGATTLNASDNTSPKLITSDLWPLVSAEVIRQCDALDGVVDGIITEPDGCDFRPEALQCTGTNTTGCLTSIQVETLKTSTPPIRIGRTTNLSPISPGAEADTIFGPYLLGGALFEVASDWQIYAVLNATEYDFSNFSREDIVLSQSVNAGGIATFDGDMSAFRDRGGKFITYHGRRDPLISSTNSKRVYDLISHTLSIPSLDDFYRLFLVPGMSHCSLGIGSPFFGQGTFAGTNVVNSSSHNVLLAMVDWVEGGVSPDEIIGSGADGSTRAHCRYPKRSVWNGTEFICEK